MLMPFETAVGAIGCSDVELLDFFPSSRVNFCYGASRQEARA
jgi:hypothetical protein